MENRKMEIIQAASECFSEKGYFASSVSDICKAAGIAKGGFYWHFSSKKEALKEVLSTKCQSQEHLWEKLHQIEITGNQVAEAGWAFIQMSLEDPTKTKLFALLEQEAADDEELVELYKENQRILQNHLLEFAEDILEQCPHIKMDKTTLANLILLTVNGLVHQAIFGLVEMDIRRIWEGFVMSLIEE